VVKKMRVENTESQARLVCIHQPDFFPWLGFFDKMLRSDIFILLDHVQFPKTGGTYCNRVKLKVGSQGQWVTAPVNRSYNGLLPIKEVEFQPKNPWREKMFKTILSNYRGALFFDEAMQMLEPLIRNPEDSISTYNTHAVLMIGKYLNMPSDHIRWSSRLLCEGASTELLISLTRAVGGTTYMCGSGAINYQNDVLFAQAGVNLIHRDYSHPIYQQGSGKDFIAGLSIIDALMHVGIDGVRELLGSGGVGR